MRVIGFHIEDHCLSTYVQGRLARDKQVHMDAIFRVE